MKKIIILILLLLICGCAPRVSEETPVEANINENTNDSTALIKPSETEISFPSGDWFYQDGEAKLNLSIKDKVVGFNDRKGVIAISTDKSHQFIISVYKNDAPNDVDFVILADIDDNGDLILWLPDEQGNFDTQLIATRLYDSSQTISSSVDEKETNSFEEKDKQDSGNSSSSVSNNDNAPKPTVDNDGCNGHWEERSWQEKVIDREAYDEPVYETVANNTCTAYGQDSVEGYQCNFCGYQTTSLSDIDEHTLWSHTDNRSGYHNIIIYVGEEHCLAWDTSYENVLTGYIHHDEEFHYETRTERACIID